MADDKIDRVFRAIGDAATSVADLVRATNLSHPTVTRIARELARQGKVFEFRPDRDPAKGSAQRAFFEAAFGRPAAAQATAAPQTAAPTAAPAQKIPANLPADPPQKILRPGSLLDIRV